MKKNLLSIFLCLFVFVVAQAEIPISTARTMAEGSTVTVRGIVTNAGELGTIRYLQDPTGGIAAYSTSLATVQRGDSVEITGVLDFYNNLIEINPVSSYSVISSGNPLPEPFVVNMATGYTENYESRLVRFNNSTFISVGSFSASADVNYEATDGSVTSAQVRTIHTSNIAGTPIPNTPLDIIGIMSQYQTTYQLIPRDLDDFVLAGNPPVFTNALSQSNITTTSFDVSFNTLNPGTTVIYYGTTPTFGSEASNATLVTDHTITLSGLTAATLYYLKGVSVGSTGDTSFSAVATMITQSLSSGVIKTYFTRSVDNTVAQGTNAVSLPQIADDTLIAYMNRTVYTMDIAIYNMDNDNGIVDAINAAYNRGVNVRVIGDGDNMDGAAWAQLNIGAANKKLSPTGIDYGIMHNKFVIMDAGAADPNKVFLWTGSMNFTNQQINSDANNVIIFQDQSIAKAYQVEFNEMWSGVFGPDKTNNTPKEFVIGGNRVELYFSPSDDTEAEIKRTATSADHDLELCVFADTRFSISYAIDDRTSEGVWGGGVIDDTSNGSFAYSILASHMAGTLFVASHSYLVHNKYMLVDANAPGLDPVILTGSHNWSTSAQTKNDENTVVVHNASIANQYYQEWVARYHDEGGTLLPSYVVGIPATSTLGAQWTVYPNPTSNFIVLEHHAMLNEKSIVRIVDLSGRTLLEQVWNNSTDRQTMDVSSLNNGMYLVILKDGPEQITGKFQVVK
ncbi:MAG: T9SS type A sorting domain-containing protein [Chitinophagaceae bacterium]|nr:T9SS type A sorting domain-containing protein [Chitinophagaceae bacterium]